VSRYQVGETNLDFTEARDSEWQWHQLGHMHYASLHLTPDRQPCQHPTTQFFTGRMPFLPPNQQRQSTEGKMLSDYSEIFIVTRERRRSGGTARCNDTAVGRRVTTVVAQSLVDGFARRSTGISLVNICQNSVNVSK